jgi:hypothetical protein
MEKGQEERAEGSPRRRAASSRPPIPWLPPLFFWLSMSIAVGLVALVVLTPWVNVRGIRPPDLGRVLSLFAQDMTVRRTGLASAVGLVVTACVFFRSLPPTRSTAPRKSTRPAAPPPPTNIVGA